MLLVRASAETVVPCRAAMPERVSPARTVTVPPEELAEEEPPAERPGSGAAVVPPSRGMTSRAPGRIHRPPWGRELARTIAWGLTS